MRILVAPDKFKGSLTAAQAGAAMAEGIRRLDSTIEVDICPIADGGEGTLVALRRGFGSGVIELRSCEVAGPMGIKDRVRADWLLIRTAGSEGRGWLRGDAIEYPVVVIELASAAGMALVSTGVHEGGVNPLSTTTFGVGEMIGAALDRGVWVDTSGGGCGGGGGVRTVLVALGGSATCDGGCGMAQALGAVFELEGGERLGPSDRAFCGSDLLRIQSIDLTGLKARLDGVRVLGLYDVQNPLLGAQGTAVIYAPQKGASAAGVDVLGRGLARLAGIYAKDVDATQAGMGAAGGAGFGLVAFFDGELQRGIEVILGLLDFRKRVEAADIVLTGEGKLDQQTLAGKALMGVAELAREEKKPVLAVVGCVDSSLTDSERAVLDDYLTCYVGLTEMKGVSGVQDAVQRADLLLSEQTKMILAEFLRPK